MEQQGGIYTYEAWCETCMRVVAHFNGQCTVCHPSRYPHPYEIDPRMKDGLALGRTLWLQSLGRTN